MFLSGCTQDETLSPASDDLPAHTYPLQIGNITLTADEQPWTRMAENGDGMGSHWTGDERIGVRIGDNEETGFYTIKVDDAGNVTVTPDKPVYWKNTQPAKVTAWYPATDGSVYLSNQENGLAYVLRGQTASEVSYQTENITLNLTHQLAKVRVVTKGNYDLTDATISVSAPASCTVSQGNVTPNGQVGMISMRKTTYSNLTCWEANLPPCVIQDFVISIPGISKGCTLDAPITLEAGAMHTVTLTVDREGT